jgi:hypothetical protein
MKVVVILSEKVNQELSRDQSESMEHTVQYNPIKFGANKLGLDYSDSAIALINTRLQDGDKITFPKGYYKFQQPVIIEKNVEIDFCHSTIDISGQDGFIFKGTLKTIKTVTDSYVETKSKNSLTLSDVTDIAVGDLINVISNELYNNSRAYYYKGGNAIVTKIMGNTVYFNLVFPFNMESTSITVKIYNPIKVQVKNIGMLRNTNILDNTLYGLRIEYGVGCEISNVKTENFKINVDIYRCVDIVLNYITTGHAKDEGKSYDGYGVCLESSTNITCNYLTTNSGQHGLTTGGREVLYNITINNSTIKAEVWNIALGVHGNTYNLKVYDSVVFGFALSGNIEMNNCTVPSSEVIGHKNSIDIVEDSRYANYTFNHCAMTEWVEVRDRYHVYAPAKYKIGNIIFNDCPKVWFYPRVKVDSGNLGKIGEYELVEFNRCKGFRCHTYDKIKRLNVINSESYGLDSPSIQQIVYLTTYEKIDELNIEKTKLGNRYDELSLRNIGKLIFNSISFNDIRTGSNNGRLSLQNINEVIFRDCDMSNAEYGIQYANSGIVNVGNITVYSSKIKFSTTLDRDNTIKGVTRFTAYDMIDIGTSEILDILTATDGKKYKRTIDSTGTQILTAFV